MPSLTFHKNEDGSISVGRLSESSQNPTVEFVISSYIWNQYVSIHCNSNSTRTNPSSHPFSFFSQDAIKSNEAKGAFNIAINGVCGLKSEGEVYIYDGKLMVVDYILDQLNGLSKSLPLARQQEIHSKNSAFVRFVNYPGTLVDHRHRPGYGEETRSPLVSPVM